MVRLLRQPRVPVEIRLHCLEISAKHWIGIVDCFAQRHELFLGYDMQTVKPSWPENAMEI